MASALDGLALYLRLIRARIRAQTQYPASLAIEIFAVLVFSALDFAVILVIFVNVPRLGDWSMPEVALLYAITTLAFALTDLVIGHLDLFPELIRDGNFDLVLIRPRSTLLQIVTRDFQLRRLGKAVQGLFVLGYALAQLHVSWSPDRVLVLAVAPIAGAVIFGAIWVAGISVAFWTVDAKEVANAFTYGGQAFAQYPISVYERWLRWLLAYLGATAFISYLPTLYVLGKPDALGLPAGLQLASPLVAVVASLVAGSIWSFAVRHYRSAGG